MNSRRRNLLIEVLLGTALLVVVTIFVFPIFKNAQITGRIANQKRYLQSIVDALAAYEADHGPVLEGPYVYPVSEKYITHASVGTVYVQWEVGKEFHPPWPHRIGMAHKLPAAIVMHSFDSDLEKKEIQKIRWIIIARLPFKNSSEPRIEDLTKSPLDFDDKISGSMAYDSSNGIVSAGFNVVSASHCFVEPSVKSAE